MVTFYSTFEKKITKLLFLSLEKRMQLNYINFQIPCNHHSQILALKALYEKNQHSMLSSHALHIPSHSSMAQYTIHLSLNYNTAVAE